MHDRMTTVFGQTPPTKENPPKGFWTPLRWMEYVDFRSEHLVYVLLPPRSAWNSEIWEATEHLHTEVTVPRGSSLTPPPLPFHALRNARQTSERVGVHGDSDINKPASNTVQILRVTLHLLPVVLSVTVRARTFCFSGHNRCINRAFWSEPAAVHVFEPSQRISGKSIYTHLLFISKKEKSKSRVRLECDRCRGKLPAKWHQLLTI